MPDLVEQVLERSGYLDARGRAHGEAQGRVANIEELVGVAASTSSRAEEPEPVALPRGDLARLRPGWDPRGAEPRLGDDAAHREGAGVPRRLHDRDGGGHLPARAGRSRSRRSRRSGGWLCRHDAGEGAAHAAARVCAVALRAAQLQPAVRFLDELPERHVERERLRPASWAGYGAPVEVDAALGRSVACRPAIRCGMESWARGS